jgi:homospermidine synthase
VVAAQSRHVDGLSVLLLDRSGPVWWCGWPTKICEAASLASAASWVVRHPRSGVRVPDDLPHDALLDQVRPWLGEPQSQPLAPISCDFRMQDSQFMSLLA